MSMTSASSEYFERVAGEWDELRAGYFGEAVRAAAIRKAYLRPEFVVADVGAGTGFMTAGLAPLVRRVYAIDGSPAMLAVAQENLAVLTNIEYHLADGLTLPLPDESLDAVFANMYLHHLPDPLLAIQEMVRVLRPGGRLVITDMDAHPHAWLKEEMADAWQGFERQQVRAWLAAAGLVNVIVDCTGEACCAGTQAADVNPDSRQVQISTFVAVGTRRTPGVRAAVQAGYGAAAEGEGGCCAPVSESEDNSGCCTPVSKSEASSACCGSQAGESSSGSCCGGGMEGLITISDDLDVSFVPGYSPAEQQAAPPEAASLALGCGNPTALAGLKTGEVVLDIGSGGGLDAFLAAGKVGPAGHVIGVDMTPAMLARARAAAAKAGLGQVEFRQGQAEALPAGDGEVDVVISNCVINLCEDKGQVFGEAFRVLRPGGRLEVSDMVTSGSFPPDLIASPENWPGCVYGALPEGEYVDLVAQAGFKDIRVRRSASSGLSAGVAVYSVLVSARK